MEGATTVLQLSGMAWIVSIPGISFDFRRLLTTYHDHPFARTLVDFHPNRVHHRDPEIISMTLANQKQPNRPKVLGPFEASNYFETLSHKRRCRNGYPRRNSQQLNDTFQGISGHPRAVSSSPCHVNRFQKMDISSLRMRSTSGWSGGGGCSWAWKGNLLTNDPRPWDWDPLPSNEGEGGHWNKVH